MCLGVSDQTTKRIALQEWRHVDVGRGDSWNRVQERASTATVSVRPYVSSQFHQFYDVTSDGQFVMVRRGSGASADSDLMLVENWFEELTAKLEN